MESEVEKIYCEKYKRKENYFRFFSHWIIVSEDNNILMFSSEDQNINRINNRHEFKNTNILPVTLEWVLNMVKRNLFIFHVSKASFLHLFNCSPLLKYSFTSFETFITRVVLFYTHFFATQEKKVCIYRGIELLWSRWW